MRDKIINRMRDPRPWVSTFALLFFVLRTYFKIEIVNSDILVNLILTSMGAWGIWKNWNQGEVVVNNDISDNKENNQSQ